MRGIGAVLLGEALYVHSWARVQHWQPSAAPTRQSGQTVPIRMDLAEYVPMTAEQRDRALNALASLLAATWTDDNNAVDLGAV